MKHRLRNLFTAVVLALSASSALAQMDLDLFRSKGESSTDRCIGAREKSYCDGELRYALENSLLTQAAYDWGVANEYYPVISRRNTIEAVCKCGCFEQDTKILLTDPETQSVGYVAIKNLRKDHLAWALTPAATLSSLETAERSIKDLVSGPELVELYVFRTEDGRILKLTQHHGTVLADGRVIAAKDVREGQAFLDAETGKPVRIASISREPTADKVYNFKVAGDDSITHVIVAEGLLVGDLAWQNGLAPDLGKVLIRQ